jgi:germination protein M
VKKFLCLLLAAVICVSSCACSGKYEVAQEDMINPARFYYCASEPEDPDSHSYELGIMQWEIRDLRLKTPSFENILTQYLDGPKSEGLTSPFPKGLGIEYVTLDQGLLTIRFDDTFFQLRGAALTTAAACIVNTMTQFDGIELVCLETPQTMVSGVMSVPLEPSDFVLVDDYTTSDQTEIRLYFPNQTGRFLREEGRSETIEDDSGLPAFILRQLLEGPQSATALPAFPAGTELLDVQVTDGLCSVNLNEAFSQNAPEDILSARLQLLSVVNSLTELETVQFVRFLTNGQALTRYGILDLPSYFQRDESAMEPLEPSLTHDVTFWLPYRDTGRLIAVPYSVRRSGSKTAEQSVLHALLQWEAKNGCNNPFPDDGVVVDIKSSQKICRVTLDGAYTEYKNGSEEMKLAIRSIVATLCALDTVTRVEILFTNDDDSIIQVSRIVLPDDSWYLS